jgi:hypothetical protein
MLGLKPVTPAEAQKVWTSIRRPSARRVARALTQVGRAVHFGKVAPLEAQNWRPIRWSLGVLVNALVVRLGSL